MDPSNTQIPSQRKALYYGGMALTGVGFLLFLSTLVSGFANFGNFEDFEGRARSQGLRALAGMILMMVGGGLMKVGAKGWAGSGIVLDPSQARRDIEPWSRMGGGVVQDALSEVELAKRLEQRLTAPDPQVKVRCQKCQALNDEAAKLCNQCGASI